VSEWWTGLPAAEAAIRCGGARHRLRWEAGALTALDHSDLEGERALAALGEQRCACVDAVDAWERHADDLRVLVLASRGPGDRLRIDVDEDEAEDEEDLEPLPPGERALELLLGLGGALPDRLVAAVAAAWAKRAADGSDAARLHAALHGRVVAAVRLWLGEPSARVEVSLGDDRRIGRRPDGVVAAQLPVAWLGEVWARGIAVHWGRFCLAAETADGRRWSLTTVGSDFGPQARVGVELPDA
jgi:hypothetical protein